MKIVYRRSRYKKIQNHTRCDLLEVPSANHTVPQNLFPINLRMSVVMKFIFTVWGGAAVAKMGPCMYPFLTCLLLEHVKIQYMYERVSRFSIFLYEGERFSRFSRYILKNLARRQARKKSRFFGQL